MVYPGYAPGPLHNLSGPFLERSDESCLEAKAFATCSSVEDHLADKVSRNRLRGSVFVKDE